MKKLKYALSFFKRINLLVEFIKDINVSILKKIKVIGLLVLGFMYFISPIDIIPEVFLGFGIIDDTFIILYILTTINEELDRYSNLNKKYDSKIVDDIFYEIKDKD